jgi:hypothetical protein
LSAENSYVQCYKYVALISFPLRKPKAFFLALVLFRTFSSSPYWYSTSSFPTFPQLCTVCTPYPICLYTTLLHFSNSSFGLLSGILLYLPSCARISVSAVSFLPSPASDCLRSPPFLRILFSSLATCRLASPCQPAPL